MRTKLFILGQFKFLLFIVLATVISPLSLQTSLVSAGQKAAIPSYFYPGSYWTQLENGAPTVGIAIINPNSGPGKKSDPQYVDEVKRAKTKGICVLGYASTSYGNRPINEVKNDIDKYYAWYGVGGIFLDEAANSSSSQPYYLKLFTYVKGKSGSSKVVINPGTHTAECYIKTADIIVNFEDQYSAYLNWQPSEWEYRYPPNRFWHLVINTSLADMPNAIAISKNRQVGWIYVTPDILPNPWDTLPPDLYWSDELVRISQ